MLTEPIVLARGSCGLQARTTCCLTALSRQLRILRVLPVESALSVFLCVPSSFRDRDVFVVNCLLAPGSGGGGRLYMRAFSATCSGARMSSLVLAVGCAALGVVVFAAAFAPPRTLHAPHRWLQSRAGWGMGVVGWGTLIQRLARLATDVRRCAAGRWGRRVRRSLRCLWRDRLHRFAVRGRRGAVSVGFALLNPRLLAGIALLCGCARWWRGECD